MIYISDNENNITDTNRCLDEQKTSNIQDLLSIHDGNINNRISKQINFPGISQILPSLYLCGAGVAIPCYMEKLKITCVINAAPELPDTPLPDSNPLYLQVPVLDKSNIDLEQYFDEVSDLIEEIRLSDGITLVHCVAGVSRSASLCIAYLIKHANMNLKEAYLHIKTARSQIRPNIGFFKQLISFEERILGKTSVKMVFKESLGNEIPDVYEPEYEAMEIFYQKHRNTKRR